MSKQTINTSTATDTLATGFDKVNSNFTEVYASVIQAGFIIDYVGSSSPSGWLICNGATIGNAASSATGRANADTATLFDLLWNNWANAQAAVSGGRGATSSADFAANKTIAIPDFKGRTSVSKSASGTLSTLGSTAGEETHTLSSDSIPNGGGHVHTFQGLDFNQYAGASAGTDIQVQLNPGSASTVYTDTADGYSAALGLAHNNIQPSLVINKIIKL